MKRAVYLIWFFNVSVFANAENYQYQSSIDSIPQDGFQKIILIPEIVSALKNDYSDIRIFDSKNNEIPYLLTKESAIRSNSYFREYKILENQNLIKPAVNRVIIENPLVRPISDFFLIVRNSAIEKEITLKGSDDLKNWFIITQNYPSNAGLYQNEISEIKVLDFPKSNYKYFMLQMSTKKEDPLQILKVGYYDINQETGQYSEVPVLSVIQNDSSKYKKSFITVSFSSSFEISKMVVQISGPEIYLRNCNIFNVIESGNKKIKEFAGSYVISSAKPSIWELNTLRTNHLLILIDNEDNVPLKITKVNAYQLNAYLIANLHRNVKYYLRFGNKDMSRAEYDIKYFADSIPAILTQIKSSVPIRLKIEQSKTIVHSFFNNTIMWIVLVLIIALLTFLTLKLIKEIT